MRLKAFSLIEISIVLLIIGILMFGIIKGTKLINSAKIQATATQIIDLKNTVEEFISNNEIDDISNLENVLVQKKILNKFPKPKIGGKFFLKDQDNKFIMIANEKEEGFLTDEESNKIKNFIDEGEDIVKINGSDNKKTISIKIN